MKKNTRLFKALMLLSLVILLSNCVATDADEINHSGGAARKWYEKHQNEFSAAVLEYAEDLRWENAIISQGEQGEVIEVPFTLGNLSTTNEKGNLYHDHHRLVFIKDGQDNYKAYYVQIFTTDQNSELTDGNFSYYGMKDTFDGKVFVENLNTNKINAFQFVNGKKMQPSLTSKWREETYDCTFLGYWGIDGSFTPIKLLYCDGGGFDDEEPYPQYGGAGGGAGGGITKPVKPQIIDNLTGKSKCINTLLTENGNSFVENLLNKFAGKSEFNVELQSRDKIYNSKNQEINGTTQFDAVRGVILIDINTSRIDALSALEAARILLHEYIHADMYRKLKTSNINDIDASNFRQVYEAYGNQHTSMANLYLTSMAEALKDFHKNVLKDDYQKYINYFGEAPSDEFYKAMSWGGLKEGDVEDWNKLSDAEKAAIKATVESKIGLLSKTAPCKN